MSAPMSVSVSTAFLPSLGVLSHDTVPPPTPSYMPSVEMLATQMWTYGYVLNMNKLTMRTITGKDPVYHLGQPIVLSGHDCGPLIPDITPSMPSNAWYAVMWPLSERKIAFAASTVKMNGKPTGCAQTAGLPPLPVKTCGDPISAPTAFMHPIQILHSVSVGFTWADLAKGLVSIAVSIILDVLVLKAGKLPKGSLLKRATRPFQKALDKVVNQLRKPLQRMGLQREAAEEVAGGLIGGHVVPTDAAGWAKKGLASASNFGISALFDDKAKQKFKLGGPFANVEASREIELDPEPGEEVSQKEKVQGSVLGWQRDTAGGGANWGETMPGPDN